MLCPKKKEPLKLMSKYTNENSGTIYVNTLNQDVTVTSPSHHKCNQINGMQQCVMNTVSHSNVSESSPAPLCEPQTLHYTPLWGGYSITCLVIKKSTNHERAPFHSSCDVGTTALLLASCNPTISHRHSITYKQT